MPGMRILAIDDEQIVLDSIEKILSAENHLLDQTTSSRQGLEWALQRDYDLVLADVRMPEIGGMRVLRDVKRAKPSLPVVIVTGYATVQSAVQAMKLGATDYLEKPFTPDELLQAVQSALDAQTPPVPVSQGLIHRDEVLRVLDRAATDPQFVSELHVRGADALEPYGLTGPEMLALLTGDLPWIESHVGPLTEARRRWFEERLSAEIW